MSGQDGSLWGAEMSLAYIMVILNNSKFINVTELDIENELIL